MRITHRVISVLFYKVKGGIMRNYFTSESVTEGHPDKICDQISDAVLDAYLSVDPNCHVACETAVTKDFVLIMGETNSKYKLDLETIVRNIIIEIGYNQDNLGFNGNTCEIINKMHTQSSDIDMGVSKEDTGAGDQGIMFGYACNETKTYMPLPIYLAHELTKKLAEVRKNNKLSYLRPDGKSQVTVIYENNKPVEVDTILISTQHDEYVSQDQIKEDLIKYVINEVIPKKLIKETTKILINPTGRFVIGGPLGDSGLTGRKIIVDTYGGYARHGGGAFSGKDSTKVDRSAAYMARYIAKNLVAANIATHLEIQLSYAIGVSKPLSIFVETFNTSNYSDEQIINVINKIWDLRPKAIIKELNLNNPIYSKLAAYGHMGREDLNVKWEFLDKVELIKELI
jgi:S-adenosylmethionine synthetase